MNSKQISVTSQIEEKDIPKENGNNKSKSHINWVTIHDRHGTSSSFTIDDESAIDAYYRQFGRRKRYWANYYFIYHIRCHERLDCEVYQEKIIKLG